MSKRARPSIWGFFEFRIQRNFRVSFQGTVRGERVRVGIAVGRCRFSQIGPSRLWPRLCLRWRVLRPFFFPNGFGICAYRRCCAGFSEPGKIRPRRPTSAEIPAFGIRLFGNSLRELAQPKTPTGSGFGLPIPEGQICELRLSSAVGGARACPGARQRRDGAWRGCRKGRYRP